MMRSITQILSTAVLAVTVSGCGDAKNGSYEEHGPSFNPEHGTPVHQGQARNWCASARLNGYGKPYMTMGMPLGGNCPRKSEPKMSEPK